MLGEARDVLGSAMRAASPAVAADMAEESELLRSLADRAIFDDASRGAKFNDADRARKGRKRRR